MEVSKTLGWPESDRDASHFLVWQTEEIARGMPETRFDAPPAEFWPAWFNMARVWVMAAGRRHAGRESADREVTAWADHSLIADDGWSSIEAALDGLYQEFDLDLDQVARQAAAAVRRPIIAHGLEAWRPGP